MQKIINETKLDFDDVLIRPKRSFLNSRSQVDLKRIFKFTNTTRSLECVPIMVANMDTVGTFNMSKSLYSESAITCLHKHYSATEYINFYSDHSYSKHLSFYSTGTSRKDLSKLVDVYTGIKARNCPLPNICVDVANGYTEQFIDSVAHIRELYPEIIIMAGNVVTPEMVEELILHGRADIVKIGIGSGSVCTTRLKTGVGYPQLSAVMECADAAHGLGGHICSDGGCKNVGDVCKAFGGNTDFVMLGSMFAGCDECEGHWEFGGDYTTAGGKRTKGRFTYYGMSSKMAMDKHHNGVADYRTDEGKSVTVPYKGLASEVIKDIYGGLRSACTYIGAERIKDFGKKTTFIQVNNTHNRIYEHKS